MTNEEAIKILELAKEDVEPLDICIAIDKAIEVLGIDLSTPMNFTKEQSKWIKSYVILKRQEAKAEAIEEFYAKCREKYWFSSDFMNFFEETRKELKEQKNERR